MSEIIIRHGMIDDLDRVTAKIHEFAPRMLRQVGAMEDQIDEWLRFYADRPRWRKRLVNIDSAVVVIAEREDIVMGLGYAQSFRDLDNAVAVRFGGLYVRYPNQGIGGAVMRERLRVAKTFKADYVQLECAENNSVMRAIAEKQGFEMQERYQHQIIDHVPFLRYRKAITEFGEDYLTDLGPDAPQT